MKAERTLTNQHSKITPVAASAANSTNAVVPAASADQEHPYFPPLLTVTDLAKRLQVSERQVRRWIAQGRVPAVHFGRAVRIRLADLEQLLTEGLTQNT